MQVTWRINEYNANKLKKYINNESVLVVTFAAPQILLPLKISSRDELFEQKEVS